MDTSHQHYWKLPAQVSNPILICLCTLASLCPCRRALTTNFRTYAESGYFHPLAFAHMKHHAHPL
jgi:hypothetical protein